MEDYHAHKDPLETSFGLLSAWTNEETREIGLLGKFGYSFRRAGRSRARFPLKIFYHSMTVEDLGSQWHCEMTDEIGIITSDYSSV